LPGDGQSEVNRCNQSFIYLEENSFSCGIATRVAGLSIEDATGDSMSPLYDLPIALERVRAARQAIDESGHDVLLTARAECYHVGDPDPLHESVRRLQAYTAAEADVLFAPGPQSLAEIKTLVEEIAPKPLSTYSVGRRHPFA
jgi:2-methylisocitrate lyase-like PEP mutase family enzyme